MINDPITLTAEFIAPFEDNLTVIFIGNNLNADLVDEFKTAMNTTRHLVPVDMNPIEYISATTSELFHGKLRQKLNPNNTIVYLDSDIAKNVINVLTHSSDDKLDEMLIDKFLIQQPQEKYIFNLGDTTDDVLARLLQTMDNRPDAFNYMIIEDYLAVWLHYSDEFSLIQQI